MSFREFQESREHQFLASYATFSGSSRGRLHMEEPCPLRTDFQRDRDRILHSNSFRRLKHKTQVFLAPEEDHYRTRLTHTLEVSQVARTISRALLLNEDLTEAIALGHDLGHTPFGHIGEAALDSVWREYDSNARFCHYEQSLRVVDLLENGGQGLNLTWEVRDGILHHSKGREDLKNKSNDLLPSTPEGQVVRIADRIAYLNHDLDDALSAGVISESQIPDEVNRVLGTNRSNRIGTMVIDVVNHSESSPHIKMGLLVQDTANLLKDFLFEKVYNPVRYKANNNGQPDLVIRKLFNLFMENPDKLPFHADENPKLHARQICDFIAGMTDRYAQRIYSSLFIADNH